MLTGYWPPTNEMLRKFSTDPNHNPGVWEGENWEGRGYNIYAFFPEFPGGTGSNPKGSGDFEIDYQDVSSDFWRLTNQVHPAAIMSYGQGTGPWEIECNARNLPSSSWTNDYLSPLKPTPAPPDSNQSSGYVRHSSLPVEAIAEAVNSSGLGINAWVDWDVNPGAFLCEYMAYHDGWYQSLHSDPCDPYYCAAAGFTHLAAGVSPSNGTIGVEAALRALIKQLNFQLIQHTISGTVTSGGSPLAGVTMCGLSGNPVTNSSGVYTAQVGGGWSGAVTPLKSGYAFTQKTYSNVSANQSAQDYTATTATAEAIVFDTASNTSSSTAGTTLSWSHTVGSGSNRVLVVSVVTEDSTAADQRISSVKFNGVDMTPVSGSTKSRTVYSGTSYSSTLRTDLYYMLNPAVGTYTVLITHNGSVSYRAGGAISLNNVKQQVPEAIVANSATSASISTNIDVPNTGVWIVDVVGHSNSGSFTSSTTTERWDKNSSYHTGAGGTKAITTSGSNTITWTFSGSSGAIVHSLAAFAPSETTTSPPGVASNPTPVTGATNVGVTTDLSWSAGSGATSHDIYFGTTSPGTFRGNQTATTYDTNTMSYNTTYYWRIDEKGPGGTTTGTVWSFATNALVPNVIGSTQAVATTAINGAGLVVGTVSQQYSNTVAAGLVISQNPVGGTQVNIGSTVNLVISLGKPVVPNVVGSTQAAATTAITAVDNLTVGTVTQAYSNTVAAGIVISQNPVSGTAVNIGSTVSLVVSLGKPVVPNVVDMTQAAATTAITAVDNLTVGTVTQAYSDTVAAGLVISQNPIGGTQVNTGSAVDIVVSLGLPVIPVVTGQAQAAAQAAITAATFTVGTVTTAHSDTVAAGNVISQSPVGGTAATSGTAVNMTVSLGFAPRIISGYITEPDANVPVEVVVVNANSGGGSGITDVNGYYQLTVDYGWSGTATPTKEGYTFVPSSISYDNIVTNEVNDYTATLSTFFISGRITDGVTPISDVNVVSANGGGQWTSRYGGGSDVTDTDGYYEVVVDYNWSGNVVPSKYAYAFEPNSIAYTNVTAGIAETQNYVGTLLTYIIAGYIKNSCEVPIEDVLVNANNGGNSDTTDTNGYYEVWVDYNWSGTITPSKVHYTFEPNSKTYTDVLEDKMGLDYSADNIYDLDCDGTIGYSDVAVISENWLDIGLNLPGDFYKDETNTVNFLDFADFANVWRD